MTSQAMPPEVRYVLPRAIEHQARAAGDRIFVQEVGGADITYGGMHERVLAWAGLLRQRGVGPHDHVATMLSTSIESLCASVGLGWLLARDVPVNLAYRGSMLAYTLQQSRAGVAIVEADYVARIAELGAGSHELHTVIVVGSRVPDIATPFAVLAAEELFADVPPGGTFETPRPGDIAAVLYTSGTTGSSKGVLAPWRQVHQTATGLDANGDLTADDTIYNYLPLAHMSGRSMTALSVDLGSRLVLRERFRTSEFWQDVDTYRCTTAMLLGAMANWLVAEPESPADAGHSLRNALMVPLPPDVPYFENRFQVRIHTWFGMTEVGIPIALRNWDARNGGGCGHARPGYQCRIVDKDDNEVAPGQVGELVIRTDEPHMISQGYFDMPAATLESWRNLWLHTGDAAVQEPSGEFRFVDRWKDSIRRRGENISSMEVEKEIVSHPEVVECAVTAQSSEWSEDEVRAFVVRAAGSELTARDLVNHLVPRMPHYMVPRYVDFVDQLPKTASEKIRKAELRTRELADSTWDREAAGMRLSSTSGDQ